MTKGVVTLRLVLVFAAMVGCGRLRFELADSSDAAAQDGPSLPTADARSTATLPTPISDTGAQPECPSLVWTGSAWAVAWRDERDGALGEVYFTLVDSNGAKLIADLRVTNDPASTGCPSLAWSGTNLLVVFDDARMTYRQIYGQFISAAGALVSAPVITTSGNNNSSDPLLARDGSGYDLVYVEQVGGFYDLQAARLTTDAAISGAEVIVFNNAQYTYTSMCRTPAGLAISSSVYLAPWSVRLATIASSTVQYDVPIGTITTSVPTALAWTGSVLALAWRDPDSSELMFAHADPSTGALSGIRPVSAVAPQPLQLIAANDGIAIAGGIPTGQSLLLVDTDGVPRDAPVALGGIRASCAFDGSRFGCATIAPDRTAIQLTVVTPM